MKLYNTLTRKIENFKSENPNEVKIYTCGPTVYGYQHIGNYASYIYWDLLIRTLTANNYVVKRVLNITDVGHLASDADDGEDKLEKGASREGKTVWEVAEFYMNDFLKNFRTLNLTEPTKITRATDYIEQDIALVNTLTEKGYTYETSDGIYFDTAKFPHYADFAKLDLENLKAGARVEFNSEKHNPSDFAVWKFIKPGETHAMRWDYLGRPGYPGWHLECSTIIHSELGEPIDIHTGGIDHIPVHHTNEIAQSEAAYGTKLANYWLHCNFLTVNGEKISKSLGNIFTFEDLEKQGFSPMDFKMWALQGHYQSERNFTFEDLAAAKKRRLNWRNKIAASMQNIDFLSSEVVSREPHEARAVSEARDDGPERTRPKKIKDDILQELSSNLNSASSFALIDNSELSLDDWKYVDELFGLDLIKDSQDITDEQKDLIKQREQARKNKNYAKSDEIRKTLHEQGIDLLDGDKTIWQYAE